MLEKVVIKNFQKHKNLEVQFVPGVTTIVGDTNAGKSAILRLLRWVALNRLHGTAESYIRWGADDMAGILYFDNHKLIRRRGKGGNLYKLDGKEFKAFGHDVPPEIADLLAVSPDNFQRQLDPQFWLTESSGQIAKHLNAIVNLEVIDAALATAGSALKRVRIEKEVQQEGLKRINDELATTEWVHRANRSLKVVESLNTRHKVLTSKIASIASVVKDGARLTRGRDNASNAMLGAKKAASVGEQWHRTTVKIDVLRQSLNLAAKMQGYIASAVPSVDPLIEQRKKADKTASDRRTLEALIGEAKRIQEIVSATDGVVEDLQTQLKRIKVCPTCGQKLTDSRSSSAMSTCQTPHRFSGR